VGPGRGARQGVVVTPDSPPRTVVVGDALLPTQVIATAVEPVGLDMAASLSWGPADEAEVDRMALRLEREGPEAEQPPEDLWEAVADAEVLIVHYCPVGRRLLEAAPHLRILGTCRAGTENLDLRAALERRLTVLHVVGRTTEAVSDFAIGLLLTEARNIARAHDRLMDGRWDKAFVTSAFTPELEGRTIGIVGFGEIGRAVARKLEGFRMHRLAYDPFVPHERMRELDVEPADLDMLLRRSDFVTLHARVGEGDPPLLGADELASMKPTAFLINTARSSLVDTVALIEALRRRRIAGAALDVHDREPLGPDHPLVGLDNVTITPHLASSTLDCTEKSPRILAEDLRRVLRGEPARYEVDGRGDGS
jgi:D-3-phosphoglycerate dehydrogenase / 2-oxoglutarate reductase